MQALILAGGEGTRLRPLTRTTPKPVMPLAGRPFLTYMLDWLAGHGVTEAILSCGFLSDGVERVLGDRHGDMALRYVVERERLGTAGPVRLALDEGVLDERLLILNGDVLTDMDLTAEVAQHERTGAQATLALVAVEDTSSYGVVPCRPDGRVEAFLEKSDGPAPTNRINAGAYVIERATVERHVPSGQPCSFEREVFPVLVGDGLFGWRAEGYWEDIGTPERYLSATRDLLTGRAASTLPARDATGSLVGEGTHAVDAAVGPETVVGRDCRVGAGTRLERAVLHDGVRVGEGCEVVEAVLADGVVVGDSVTVGAGAMVGAGARIGSGARVLAGARIEPAAEIPAREVVGAP